MAPRGTAQKVYKAIVKRSADPALLEEVGPQIYRLRVFPIPVNLQPGEPTAKVHLWLQFRILRQLPNDWELPVLTEKRNLYWSESTVYTLNSQNFSMGLVHGPDWLPAKLPYNRHPSPN